MKKLVAILSLLLFTTNGVAQEKSKEDIILQKLEDLQKTLDTINTNYKNDVSNLKIEIGSIKSEIDTLRSELTTLKSDFSAKKPKPSIFEDEGNGIYRIDGKFVTKEEFFRKLDGKQPPIIPHLEGKSKNPPEVRYGKVKIINTYHTTQTVDVNYGTYTVKPGETVTVDCIMPGTVTYKVHGIHSTFKTRKLDPDETFTMSIYPGPATYQQNYTPNYSYYPLSPCSW
jgi:predicted RNase H-like nuclease (RuvC/YqgF family)